MAIEVRGMAARQGETAFAFFVLCMHELMPRARLVEVLRFVAPLMPDPDGFIDGIPTMTEEALQIIGLPWSPPEAGRSVDAQRRLIEGAGTVGVAAAWFFQVGTSLPPADSGEPEQLAPVDGASGDDPWSHGPPGRVAEVRFPVDHYPEMVSDFERLDLGISLKLAGPSLAGESSVLLGFHALWLAPYGGRYRNTAVTLDRTHHAAHLWVDRLSAPCSAEQLVQHLLWITSKIDEVLPILHARFERGGQPVSDLDPFVLGGNPLRAVHARGGERAVDDWLATQNAWSGDEVARMLHELAIDLASAQSGEDDDEGDDHDDDDDDHAGNDDDLGDDDDDDAADDDDDDDPEGNEDEDRGRQIARDAGELLRQRASDGLLDARAPEHRAAASEDRSRSEPDRRVMADIVAADRDAAARAGAPFEDDPDIN
jgi:hypothetical protein